MKSNQKSLPLITIKRCPLCERINWKGQWQALKPEEEVAINAYKDSPILKKILSKSGKKIVEIEAMCGLCSSKINKAHIASTSLLKNNEPLFLTTNLGGFDIPSN